MLNVEREPVFPEIEMEKKVGAIMGHGAIMCLSSDKPESGTSWNTRVPNFANGLSASCSELDESRN